MQALRFIQRRPFSSALREWLSLARIVSSSFRHSRAGGNRKAGVLWNESKLRSFAKTANR
jgi:hypothetical protein